MRWAVVGPVLAALVLTGCSSPPQEEAVVTMTVNQGANAPATDQVQVPGLNVSSSAAPTSGVAPTADVSQLRATYKPRADAVDVPPNDPVSVTVFAADLSDDVKLKAADGSEVPGEISADKSAWTATKRLDYGTTYTFEGTAVGKTTGEMLPITSSFTTVTPANQMNVQINIPEGGVVGIGAPIIVTFSSPVVNKAAAERALKVTTSAGEALEGNWGWVMDEDFQGMGVQSQVHWRPTKSPVANATPYWPASTQVTVDMDLKGVDYGNGYWGKADLTSNFSIRPDAQIVIADVASFHMVVMVDGQVVKNYPVSYGQESVPGKATTNGIHIVQAKHEEFEMCNEAFGYCNSKQKWAVRINNNGEFIHENLQNAANLGRANTSHGCINMGSPDAKEYYDSARYGDPVEITNAVGGQWMSEKDKEYDWIYTPEQWKALSALG